MPSHKYFEELTMAVLTDVDQVKGFSQRQSAEQIQQLSQDIYQRIAGTFAQLLDAEMEDVGKRNELHERMAEIRRATEAREAAEADQALVQLPAFSANSARLHVHEKGWQTRAGAR